MVVASSEDAQIVGSGDGGTVLGGDVTDSGAVASDGGLLDVVTGRGTGEESLVSDDSVDVGSRTLEQVEEGAAVEGGLLEGEVELGAGVVAGGEELEDGLRLETLGQGVGELKLGVEGVGRVPCLGQGKACSVVGR